MLLEREDIDPNPMPPGYSCTPLTIAAYYGNEGVVKVLLEREDVNPNIPDTSSGLTPLSYAAVFGHEQMVKMLLDRNDVRIDIKDHNNRTAHSLALFQGHDKIARMISERAASMSDTADPGSNESLPPSAGGGEESLVEIELRDDHSSVTTADSNRHLHPHQETQESLTPPTGDGEESAAEIELRDDYSNTNTADPSGHLHLHQVRRKGIGLRRLFSRFHR